MALIRPADARDHAAIATFLLGHVAVAMFPLANLRHHGLAFHTFPSDHPHAMRMWVIDPPLQGAIGLTQAGMLMPLLPDARSDLAGLATALAGQNITGAIGPAPAVRRVLAALNLATHPTLRDADEPGFTLDLAALQTPPMPADATLITPTRRHRALITQWRTAYQIESLGTPAGQAAARATADTDSYLAHGTHRLLLVAGQPVAMTGFNAMLPEIVQIGGVFTPVPLRGQGFAQQAVARHLAEARMTGVSRAVLFAANAAAVRAYRAIGFQPGMAMALVLFDGAAQVAACP